MLGLGVRDALLKCTGAVQNLTRKEKSQTASNSANFPRAVTTLSARDASSIGSFSARSGRHLLVLSPQSPRLGAAGLLAPGLLAQGTLHRHAQRLDWR